MSETKWEYKIVNHSNSTSMGYSNPETEDFKEKYKDCLLYTSDAADE